MAYRVSTTIIRWVSQRQAANWSCSTNCAIWFAGSFATSSQRASSSQLLPSPSCLPGLRTSSSGARACSSSPEISSCFLRSSASSWPSATTTVSTTPPGAHTNHRNQGAWRLAPTLVPYEQAIFQDVAVLKIIYPHNLCQTSWMLIVKGKSGPEKWIYIHLDWFWFVDPIHLCYFSMYVISNEISSHFY